MKSDQILSVYATQINRFLGFSVFSPSRHLTPLFYKLCGCCIFLMQDRVYFVQHTEETL